MEIQYASDLHLEFKENMEYFNNFPLSPVAPYLVLAGDTHYLNFYLQDKNCNNTLDSFFDYLSKNWTHVFMICGNHEFYGGYPISSLKNENKIRNNITLYKNGYYDLENKYRLHFSNLWTNIPDTRSHIVSHGMNDYRYIKFTEDEYLSTDIVNNIHNEAKDILLKNNDDNLINIIISHHAPCVSALQQQNYVSPGLERAYSSSDLDDIVDVLKPRYWIHGHIHSPLSEYNYKTCKCVKNTCGYVYVNQHIDNDFKLDKKINLEDI